MISLDVENRKTFIEMDSVVGKGKTCFPNINSSYVAVWSFYLSWQKALRGAKHSEQVSKIPHSLLVPLTVYGQDFCCSQWSSIVFTWPNYQLKASLLIHLWLQILSRILCAFLLFWARLFKNSKQKVLQKQFNYCPIIADSRSTFSVWSLLETNEKPFKSFRNGFQAMFSLWLIFQKVFPYVMFGSLIANWK